MNTNERKKVQLGMAPGTASHRLRKAVLFKYIKKVGENICCRCGDFIESTKDLSIDHVTPWLDSKNPTELFFDLDNIAFSHLKCNVGAARRNTNRVKEGHKRRGKNQRKIGPPGTVWCCKHQQFLSEDRFNVRTDRWNGFYWMCKECKKKYERL